jgi:hypothetical protein
MLVIQQTVFPSHHGHALSAAKVIESLVKIRELNDLVGDLAFYKNMEW